MTGNYRKDPDAVSRHTPTQPWWPSRTARSSQVWGSPIRTVRSRPPLARNCRPATVAPGSYAVLAGTSSAGLDHTVSFTVGR